MTLTPITYGKRRGRRRKRRRGREPTPDERERLIREHIRKHGVTRVPSAYSRVD